MSSVAPAVPFRRRPAVVGGLMFLVTALAATLVGAPAPPADAAGTITVSRTSVIGGEWISVTGSTGQSLARPIQLQVRRSNRWMTVVTARTTRKGRFAFSYKPSTKVGTRTVLRAHAPRARVGGTLRAARTMASRTVTTVAQGGIVKLPTNLPVGGPVSVSVRLTPARRGRVVVLDRSTMTEPFTEIARGTTDSEGQVTFTISVATAESHVFRAIVLASQGAPQYRTAARSGYGYYPVTNPRLVSGGTGSAQVVRNTAISGDGRYVAHVDGEDATLHLWDRETGARKKLVTADDVARDVIEVANDGESVVVQQNAYLPWAASAFVWTPASGTLTPIAPTLPNVTVLSSSGDAEQILVSSEEDTEANVVRRWTRSTGQLERVTPVGVQGIDGDISDDGRYVAYRTQSTLHRVDLSTALSTVVATGVYNPADMSDDGRYLTWQTTTDMIRRDMSTGVQVTAGAGQKQPRFPRISGDGSRVAYIRQDQVGSGFGVYDIASLYLWTPSTKSLVLISRTPMVPYVPVAVSDDGASVAFPTMKAYDPGDGDQDDDVYLYDRRLVRFPYGTP